MSFYFLFYFNKDKIFVTLIQNMSNSMDGTFFFSVFCTLPLIGISMARLSSSNCNGKWLVFYNGRVRFDRTKN